ncbi:MAG: RHS repeat-associated core domain-containing protein [Bacteroidales bacterium]
MSFDYYPSNELFVTEITDENGNITREYKDKQDRVILKESELLSGTKLRTYYVYDKYSNLVLVIPPIPSSNLSYHTQVPDLDFYCYEYTYDHRQRMITKKLPGKEYEEMVYDNLDRLVLFRDGNLRAHGQWKYIQYDVLSRPVKSGIITPDAFDMGYPTMNEYISNALELSTNINHEVFIGTSHINPFGYTNNSQSYLPGNYDDLTLTWYDNYDFVPEAIQIAGYHEYVQVDSDFDMDDWNYNTGRTTGTAAKVLDNTNTHLYTINFYDKFGRIIQTVSQNHLGGYDRVSTKYDFVGNVIMTLHEHNIAGSNAIKEWYHFTYDHANRLKLVKHKIGESSVSWTTMAEMQYNELGQLIEKNLHSPDGQGYWQSIDYKYNIRGWLTNINKANLGIDNTIIALDENLEAMMMVSGVNIDTIHYSLTEITGNRGESNYLKIELTDKKTIEINEGDNGESNEQGSSETKVIYLYENDADDAQDFYSLRSLNGNSYKIAMDHMHIGDSTSVMDVMAQINNFVKQQLPGQNVKDSAQQEIITFQMQGFILNSIGVDYINEDGGDDLFGMDIFYNVEIEDLNSVSQYNGNISGIAWKTSSCENKKGYGFRYDELNRLKKANYGERDATSWDWDENMGKFNVNGPFADGIQYDLNGNISGLNRYGLNYDNGTVYNFGLMDALTYQYNGNMLTSVNDNVADFNFYNNDFRDGSSTGSNEYTYDPNGNMVTDANKGITVTYNSLNLPSVIDFGSNNKIMYLYTAEGTKLKKTVYYQDGSSEVTDYIYNFVYKDNTIDFILTDEGRMIPDVTQGSGFWYEYYLKDHLGNVRLSFSDLDHDGIIEPATEVLQVNHYYPFGMEMMGLQTPQIGTENQYKYNNKELQAEHGLDWYDYGARFYDPQLGRWHVPDPLAEEYLSQSPFHFSGNNPLKFVDLNGMNYDEYLFNSNGQYTGKIEKEGEHYGTLAGKDGEKASTFSFADPVNDPKAIDAGEITQVVEVGDDAIASTLDESGVNDSENQDNKYEFIQKESNATSPEGSGKMDYVITGKIEVNGQKQPISSNTLYITTTESGKVAHNNYNFGNFLWGRELNH